MTSYRDQIEQNCIELDEFKKQCVDFAKDMTKFASQVRRNQFKKGINK